MASERELAAIEAEPDAHRRALKMADLAGNVAAGAIDRALVPRLATFLERDRDPFVRALVCRALARIGGGAARDAIVVALADSDAHVREAAWKALDPADDELAIPLLTQIVESSRGPDPRAMALHALRAIAARAGGPVALPASAIAFASKDPDRYVRAAAARAAAFLPDRSRARELVIPALDDDEGWVRESAAHGAAEGFAPIDRPALPQLCDALAFAREDATRLHLLRALASICARPAAEDRSLVGIARGMLSASDAGVRAAALLLVGTIAPEGDSALCDDLAIRLSDERPEIRGASARLLADLAPQGRTQLIAKLEAAVAQGDPPMRRSIARALRRIGGRATEPLLRQLSQDPEIAVARAAAEALSELFSGSA